MRPKLPSLLNWEMGKYHTGGVAGLDLELQERGQHFIFIVNYSNV